MMTMTLSLPGVAIGLLVVLSLINNNVSHAFLRQNLPASPSASTSSSAFSFPQEIVPFDVGAKGATITTTTTLREHTLNQDSYGESYMEEDGPKAQLLQAINYDTSNLYDDDTPPRFAGSGLLGGGDDSSSSNVQKIVDDLSGYVLPLAKPSKWKLLYTTAPDILGFQGGPLSQLVVIQNNVMEDGKQMEIDLVYKPSNTIMQLTSSFLQDIEEDRLTQTIMFDYEVGAMNKVDLQIRGTRIDGTRLGGLPSLESPTSFPFVGFTVVFNDGDIRCDRTIQGDFLYIYKRIE